MSETLTAVELEVYRHLLGSIAEEMGERLMRSAYSPNIKERRDFSCALFDERGDMMAQAAHIPVHLGSAPASVQAVIEAFRGRMEPGGRYVVNDPFAGGTHLPDITVVTPVFVSGSDDPTFYVANRAHHADVGGITPGSLPLSRAIDDEGIRIRPSLLTDDLIERVCAASRTPDERRGDMRAQLAANAVGVERLEALCGRHTAKRVVDAGRALQDYTARFIASLIEQMPNGEHAFEDVLDDDGHGHTDIPIRCAMTVAGDRATFDFTGSADQLPGPINAVRAITLSAVMYCLRCIAPTELPSNSGVLAPIEVVTRPGSVVDAKEPAAVAAGNVETSQRITDVVFGVLAQALPGRVPAASYGTMNNLTIGNAPDGDDGQAPFAYYETIAGGAGAGPEAAGGPALQCHMTNTLNTPVEALERVYPFVVERYAIRDGSGGAGRHRGGDGVIRRYRFHRPTVVTLITERRTHAPYGLSGGESGSPGRNALIRADGTRQSLQGKCSLKVEPGDQLEVLTPGGGGWGAE